MTLHYIKCSDCTTCSPIAFVKILSELGRKGRDLVDWLNVTVHGEVVMTCQML